MTARRLTSLVALMIFAGAAQAQRMDPPPLSDWGVEAISPAALQPIAARPGERLSAKPAPLSPRPQYGSAQGGACCFEDGSCQFALTESACTALGGVYLPGADCADAPCGVGACCSDDVCVDAPAYPCITAGRDFLGAGTTCADDPCKIGVGACCHDGTCDVVEEEACAKLGGMFLGPGTVCESGACLTGACCLEDGCELVTQIECERLNGRFIQGVTTCLLCEAMDICPDDSLFSMSPDGSDDFLAGTSEASVGFKRYQLFTGVGGAVQSMRWWGFDLDHIGGTTFVECIEPDQTFEITFHVDAAGIPGAEVCSYTVMPTVTELPGDYLGATLNQYDVVLPEPCVLVNGWVSIVGLGDPECWFLWMSSGLTGSYCDGCASPFDGQGLAVCLQGEIGGVLGSCCDDFTGECEDGVDIVDCIDPGLRFSLDATCDQLDPPCGVIVGACCLPDATCTIETQQDCADMLGLWNGSGSICESCPCITPCPEDGIEEGEPVCSDGYVDDFNGGCFSSPPVFSPLSPGETICGRSGIYTLGPEQVADVDTYETVITETTVLTYTLQAEFRPRVFVIDGTNGCPGEVLAAGDAFECDNVIFSERLEPGTYWFVVFPWAFTDTSFCGTQYTLSLEAGSDCIADLDESGDVGFSDLLQVLAAWGPCGEPCPEDLNGSGDVSFADLLILLDAWGDC